MFQLHARDLLSEETVELLNKIPTDQNKKKLLARLMEGLQKMMNGMQIFTVKN